MNSMKRIRWMLALGSLVGALGQGAIAAEVAGVKLEDTVRIANQELKLNGAGIRTKAIFKVYVAGLYLPEKKKATPEILALGGPRRMRMVLLREVNSEDLGQAFMDGLNANSEKAEKAKFINQTVKMGEIFASIPSLPKGSTITCDWVPGTGMLVLINDKRVGDVLPDVAFYNAFLKIWLGDNPADSDLKAGLLGSHT